MQNSLCEVQREDLHLSPSSSQEDPPSGPPLHLALLSLLAQGHLGFLCSLARGYLLLRVHLRPAAGSALPTPRGPRPTPSGAGTGACFVICSASPPSQLQTENPRRWSAFLADVRPSRPGAVQLCLERLLQSLAQGPLLGWKHILVELEERKNVNSVTLKLLQNILLARSNREDDRLRAVLFSPSPRRSTTAPPHPIAFVNIRLVATIEATTTESLLWVNDFSDINIIVPFLRTKTKTLRDGLA